MNFTKSLPKKKKIIQNNNMGKHYDNVRVPIACFYNEENRKETKPKTDILKVLQEKHNINTIETTNISLPIAPLYNAIPKTDIFKVQYYTNIHFQITNEKLNKETKLKEYIKKLETDILKFLQEKTITIENVYQERYNNINASGLGDFIRGSYFVMEFCDNNNIYCNINILNHPVSQFLEIYQNKQSLFLNNINRFEEINFHPYILNNNIITNIYNSSTNNSFIKYLNKQHIFNKKMYIYSISYPSENISNKHKEYMKQILKPCKQLELIVDNMLLELELVKKQFIIIHIRYGDDFLIKNKDSIKNKHLEMIQKSLNNLDSREKYLLISDNIIMKNILLLKYPFIKTHFNKISHTGEGLQLETNELQNTMIDFNMFSHASQVIAFSIYKHGTGFSKWATETYSIPYKCFFLP